MQMQARCFQRRCRQRSELVVPARMPRDVIPVSQVGGIGPLGDIMGSSVEGVLSREGVEVDSERMEVSKQVSWRTSEQKEVGRSQGTRKEEDG